MGRLEGWGRINWVGVDEDVLGVLRLGLTWFRFLVGLSNG
jgi:hypothetical protein